MSDIYTSLLKKLTLDDILPNFVDIAECIGLESFKELVKLCGGSLISIPTLKTILRDVRDRQIAAEFNGYNIRELAVRYDLSDTTIYDILKRNNISVGPRGPKSAKN